MYDSGFLPKNPALSQNSQQSKQIVCHNLQIAVATPLYPGTLAAPRSQASEIPILLKPSKTGQPCPIYQWLVGTALLPDNYNLYIYIALKEKMTDTR